jgi:hypothetical protein
MFSTRIDIELALRVARSRCVVQHARLPTA